MYNDKWWQLTEEERAAFKTNLPFNRGTANEPGINGYLSQDKTYSAGGKSVIRSTVKSY